jgi:hypothetical protein
MRIRSPFRSQVHVYPLADKWVVEQTTPFFAFWRDWHTAGLRVAIYNMRIQLFDND